jgi:hypothetical protein
MHFAHLVCIQGWAMCMCDVRVYYLVTGLDAGFMLLCLALYTWHVGLEWV